MEMEIYSEKVLKVPSEKKTYQGQVFCHDERHM